MANDLFCESCNTSFQRREHYERHVRTHTKEKPFTCSKCQQAFGRVDSLSRHYSTMHVDHSSPPDLGKQKPDRRRAAQACTRCSTAKIRCNGEQPCERCSQQGRECCYEPSSRRKHNPARAIDTQVTVPPPSKRTKTTHQSSELLDQVSTATVDDCNDLIMSSDTAMRPPIETQHSNLVDSLSTALLIEGNQPHDMTSTSSTVQSGLTGFDATTLTPSLDLDNLLDNDEWLNFNPDAGIFSPLVHMDLTFESWNNFNHHALIDPPSKPALFAAPAEASPIAQLYSRAHSPELDQDSVGPREYHPTSIEVDAQLIFPDMENLDINDIELEDFAHVEELPEEIVSKVTEYTLHLERKGPYPAFLEMRIPPAPVLNSWVQLYFEHFQPLFPFLHKPTFSSSTVHWMLYFAVAAVGAQFSRLKDAQLCARAMHELVRRQANSICEQRNQYGRELFIIQVNFLNQIGRMFSGERRSLEIAEFLQALPTTLARRKGLFSNRFMDRKIAEISGSINQKWQIWAHDEERRRTGFVVWLLDSYFEDFLDLGRVMRVEELQMPLPGSEERWNASSAQGWGSCSSSPGERYTFLFLPYEQSSAADLDHQAPPGAPGLEQVLRENTWKSTWTKTGILGKQVLLQQLNLVVNNRNSHPGSASFSEKQRQRAEETMLDLLQLIEDGQSSQHISEYKAIIACQLSISSALALRKSPTRNIAVVALKTIYSRMDTEAWAYISEQWIGAGEQTRLALFWASRVLHLMRSYRCVHPATPISLLRAVLILWLYSTLMERRLSSNGQIAPAIAVVLGPKDFRIMADSGIFQTEWSAVKLPGIGNIFLNQGRCKLLEKSIYLMRSLSCWAISASYAQLLDRLRESELQSTQKRIFESNSSPQRDHDKVDNLSR